MSFIKHDSTQVHSTSYEPVDRTLNVRFVCSPCKGTGRAGEDDCSRCSGAGHSSEYQYEDIPVEVYSALRDAESVGGTFNSLVKRGPYKYKKL